MKVYFSAGANIHERYQLNDGQIKIGRSISNDIIINDLGCSRNHLIIHVQAGIAILENLKPMNPVFVNERIIQERTVLRSGDFISFGETEIMMLEDNEEPVIVEVEQEAYESHDTVSIDVRKALQEVMAKDMLRVSTEATTRIKQSALNDVAHLWKK